MLLVWSQAELDKSAGIGRGLGLPAVIRLVFLHRRLAGTVPNARRFSGQIMLADQGLLNLQSALGIDFLLPAMTRYFA